MPSSERPLANKTLREEDDKVNASEDITKKRRHKTTIDRWKATKTHSPDYQTADKGPQRSLEVSDILLHGGLDSTRHISMCDGCNINLNPDYQ
jgi:hypothetical protein